MELTRERLLWMYRTMILIRRYEERMAEAYAEGKSPRFDISAGPVPGEMHLAAGHEPVAVGVCAHLRSEDTVTASHRPHHVAIAKGVDLRRMTAEIFGKKTGLGQGKGGHMHLFDPTVKFSCSGIIGAGFPPAVGAALAAKMLGKDWVAVAFAGEGAANQGSFHEALNLAALWRLPVVFVIEDNSYAISVPKSKSTAVPTNADRAAAYGIPGAYIPDNDPVAVYEVAGLAVERARRGEGPSLIEVKTYRYFGHFQGDPEVYRPKGEVEELKKRDPIARMRVSLLSKGLLTEEEDASIHQEVEATLDDAYNFARQSPYPAPEEALQHVFV
ncbi:pyruvate dehydrogenase (acetyl-transferring) E1 component subunit alpha [Thermus scotoductus]|uniref:Pyruvate dehydrogenase (Acetyl-transferring) E1 component subunit alpha n=1 Tax=Thermus scotoductus TaxID=37636 RepID=A0A430UT94_THESC|nr:thiamine pyrophosphate-dependent dehydrogenase E1 component subunit alpha [Thermus scotoductus]RTI11801.1 pyruvate dehydrogenase (acetyl-transferring) E1 component subunit alpha [Thermus scotoductus]